jgi:HisJ family histidinol phosphate phosphatase
VNADPRIAALPDIHGHAKGEHKPFAEERPIPYTARMLFLWFYHACRRASPRFLMVADHVNYLTFEDPAAVNLVRRALKLAQAGDLYGAAETAGVELGHAAAVSEGLRKGMRYSIGAEVDNDPRSRPDAQNIVDAMRPDGMVRSIHFLPITHPQHGENWMWPFDNAEFVEFYDVVGTEQVWELYMTTLLDAIEKLPGHIVGHFYVPGKFGHWPDDATLESYEDRLLDACAERGMAVEINSRYFYKYYPEGDAQIERYRTAYLRLLRKAKAKGVMVAAGSDAHSPRDQGGAFDVLLALLDEADINEIAFPINGRLARVALRATEEILRQHSAALAGPPPVQRVRVADEPRDGEDEATGDNDVDEAAEPVVPAAPAPAVAAAPALAAARPRSKPKPKPKAPPPAPPDRESTGSAGGIAVATPDEASERPQTPARESRPAKKVKPATVADPSPPDVAPTETTAEPAHEPVPEPVLAVAERIATAVAETTKRATSALVEATANLLQHGKTAPKKAAARPKSERPIAKKDSAKAAKAKSKPASKVTRPKKAAVKTAPAKAPAKKSGGTKPVRAMKVAPKKAASKKAAPAPPVAKKAATRSAARPRAKAAKVAPARGGAAKSAKRAPALKRTVAKKSLPKKAAAKKKPARSRR